MDKRELFNLYAYRRNISSDTDVLEDYVDEPAILHDEDREVMHGKFMRFLDVYHRGQTGTREELARINYGDVEHSFIRVSKPYRFSEFHVKKLENVFKAIDRHCGRSENGRRLTSLEFGAGWGQ